MKNFRNYEELSLNFDEKVNIFLGDNAQGKTNLIESIYISALSKSFRTSKDSELIKFGCEYAKVKILAQKDNEDLEIEIIITNQGKGIKINGRKINKLNELLENVYAVVFSPDDLKIVKDEPEKRRRFIDMELSQLSHSYFSDLLNYKKILKQRNILLKDIKFNSYLTDTLDIWNERLAEYGSKVILKRAEFIKKINNLSKKIHSNISGGLENLEISYDSSIDLAKLCENTPYFEKYDYFSAQKRLFLDKLNQNIEIDIKNGTTSAGPHKDDLKLSIENIDLRKFGSQGQQRTAALSLKLAEIKLIKEETGEDAILLLDDVMSELDAGRQNFLVNAFNGIQLFITTTELNEEVKKLLPSGKIFNVKKGKIE